MGWPEGYARQVLAAVDSTNAEAARAAPTLTGPTWIMALNQTSARGRRGRVWRNPAGNFAATLVTRLDAPPDQVALRSFVAALALYDAVAALTGSTTGLALKWPNDVLLNGGKLAGILLEHHSDCLAVGIGVNLLAAPPVDAVEPGAVPPVALLTETGHRILPEQFLDALAASYADWETRLSIFGFDPIRSAWLSRAARIGETITARTPRETWQGVFETVDLGGNLVLNTAKGRVEIAAADIHF